MLTSGILAVSTGAVLVRLADAPSLVIAAYRVGLATIVLAPFAWWKVREELLSLSGRELGMALLSGLFLTLHFAVWISSLNYTSVANSVIMVNTNPLWVGLLAPAITGERVKPVVIVSIIIGVAGAAIIWVGDAATGEGSLVGDALALAGGICASFYLLLGRNLRRNLSLLAYISVCYGTAAVLLWAAALASNLPVSGFSSGTFAALAAMALVPQLIGHSSYNWALKWFSTSIVALSLLGEPIGSTILAYIILDEGISATKAVGGALILAAIYVAATSEKS